MNEIWRVYKITQSDRWGTIKWEVSNYGNVKMNGKLHTPYQNDKYLRCGCFKIHIAVAELFIGPKPGPEYQVDHIDTNKHNNNVNNLRWVTHKDNQNNTLTRQHISESKKGEKHGMAKKCPYNGIDFGSKIDAYNYAKDYCGYDKSYITFCRQFKG